jgi:hypothetical protein
MCALALGGAPATAQDAATTSVGDQICGPTQSDDTLADPDRIAVLIGVNAYADPGIRDLTGAVNDVCLVRQVLVARYGFSPANIVLLTDANATRARILAAIDRQLLARAGPNSTAVIYYSGHGTQVADLNGDERRDHLDEAIVPSDGRRFGTGAIRDDELSVAFRNVAAHISQLVVFFDSCHSGDATRSVGVVRRIGERTAPSQPESAVDADSSDLPYLFISAARSNQLAYEAPIRGRTFGAFTHALVATLNEATPTVTYRDIVRRVRARLAAQGRAEQTPTIEGPGVGSVFLPISASQPSVGAPVWRDATGALWVAVGAVQGASLGAQFRLVRDDGTGPEATAHVIYLSNFASQLELVSGEAPSSNLRGVPINFLSAEINIIVGLDESMDGADHARAEASINAQDWLEIAPTGGAIDFLLTREGEMMVLRDSDGDFMARSPDLDVLLERARRWARWRRLSELGNGGTGVEIEAALMAGEAEPRPGGAMSTALELRDGDPFWVVVTNRSNRALFIGALELNDQGAITPLHPQAGTPLTPTPPGESIRLPLAAVLDAETLTASQLKVFASREPIDFAVLQQDRLRGRPLNALEQLLADASGNRRSAPIAVDSWAVRDLYVVIERAR